MIILIISIIIIIITSILIIILNNKKIIEGYDARYTNTSFPLCAEFCKTTNNCYGFGYDKVNNICYPSQLPILGKPLDSIFKKEYSYGNTTCNKIKAIDSPTNTPSFEERRSNSVYVCTESNEKQPQYYFHNKGEFKNIGEGKNIDNIFEVESYEVKPYKWPRNRFDYDQLDLLAKERENQTFTPENVTDIDRIINYVQPEHEIPKIFATPKITLKPTLDFNLENIKNNIYDFMKKIGPGFLIPTTKYEVPKDVIPERPKYITYKESDNYNTGEYINDFKCVKDIPLKTCLNYCSKDDKCVGFEWNPLFEDKQNICCPYKSIGQFIERKENKKVGRFYEKKFSNELNKEIDYITN